MSLHLFGTSDVQFASEFNPPPQRPIAVKPNKGAPVIFIFPLAFSKLAGVWAERSTKRQRWTDAFKPKD